jgi:hypothetical protein
MPSRSLLLPLHLTPTSDTLTLNLNLDLTAPQSRKILLSDDDHNIYEKWEFICKRSFQEEVVEFLMHEEKLVSL